jgi:hypothetical protein
MPCGNFCLVNTWVKNNIMVPATANLTCAITSGWEESKAILVAVDADAQRNANNTPAAIHLYSFLIVFIF